jgi:hypothetical protein
MISGGASGGAGSLGGNGGSGSGSGGAGAGGLIPGAHGGSGFVGLGAGIVIGTLECGMTLALIEGANRVPTRLERAACRAESDTSADPLPWRRIWR